VPQSTARAENSVHVPGTKFRISDSRAERADMPYPNVCNPASRKNSEGRKSLNVAVITARDRGSAVPNIS